MNWILSLEVFFLFRFISIVPKIPFSVYLNVSPQELLKVLVHRISHNLQGWFLQVIYILRVPFPHLVVISLYSLSWIFNYIHKSPDTFINETCHPDFFPVTVLFEENVFSYYIEFCICLFFFLWQLSVEYKSYSSREL